MSTQIQDLGGDTYLLTSPNASATLQTRGFTSARHISTQLRTDDFSSTVIAHWGQNNDWPQKIMKAIELCGVAQSGLSFNGLSHFGRGMMIFLEEFEDEKIKLVPQSMKDQPELWELLINCKYKKYLHEAITDFEHFRWVVTEMLVSNNYKKIVSFRHKEVAFSRFELMNEETRMIEHVYVSAHWEDFPQLKDSEKVMKIPAIDPMMSAEEAREYLRSKGIKKFVYTAVWPTPGRSYYPEAEFHSTIRNGWMDVAAKVPSYKKNLMENQMTIKYHIEIPLEYWGSKYARWGEYDDARREEIRNDTMTAVNKFLAGEKNAGKALVTNFGVDPLSGKALPGWIVNVLDDKLKDGAYVPDAQAANGEILFSMKMDPTLVGVTVPGGNSGIGGAGSGSDKREAFIIHNAVKNSHRDITTEAFEFIRDFNGHDPNIRFGFRDWEITTLDKNPTGQQNTVNA